LLATHSITILMMWIQLNFFFLFLFLLLTWHRLWFLFVNDIHFSYKQTFRTEVFLHFFDLLIIHNRRWSPSMSIEICSIEILSNSFEVHWTILWTQFRQFTCIDVFKFALAKTWSKKFKFLAFLVVKEISSLSSRMATR
jgi:hypothetical protein